MVIPVIRQSKRPDITNNPKYKKCLWLNESVVPNLLYSFNEELNDWEPISDTGNKNVNSNNPIEKFKIWVGSISDFEELDALEDDVIYHVEGLGEFIGSKPVFETIPRVKFVNNKYQGKRALGISWKFPFTNIQDAIDASNPGDQIWVAEGTYSYESNLENSYQISTNGIELYGGFKGTEYSLEERVLINKTVLDGQNKRRLIKVGAKNIVINGFRFINGSASGLNGGAILAAPDIEYNTAENLKVVFCEFNNNSANQGGAIANAKYVLNCLFVNNSASSNGSALYFNIVAYINGCTIIGGNSNCIHSVNPSHIYVTNSVIWNSEAKGDSISAQHADVTNCALSGNSFTQGNLLLSRNNLEGDGEKVAPKFTDPEHKDFTLQSDSPLIGAGKVEYYDTNTDILSKSRVSGGSLDIGAYEFQDDRVVISVNGRTGEVVITQDDIEGLGEDLSKIDKHINNTDNPHLVTKDQLGLERYPEDPNQLTISKYQTLNQVIDTIEDRLGDYRLPSSSDDPNKSKPLGDIAFRLDDQETKLLNHTCDDQNPHNVTAEQIGVGAFEGKTPETLPISDLTQVELNKINDKLDDQNVLDDNGKIQMSKLPDSILGNVRYMGTWDPNTNIPNLSNPETWKKGHYYICISRGLYAGKVFEVGDWIICNGVTEGSVNWDKVDNVDAVKSVNGRTGDVTINIEDIPRLLEKLGEFASKDVLSNHLTNESNPHKVTATQLGLGEFEGKTPETLPVSNATDKALGALRADLNSSLVNHESNRDNPHEVKVEQLLGIDQFRKDVVEEATNNAKVPQDTLDIISENTERIEDLEKELTGKANLDSYNKLLVSELPIIPVDNLPIIPREKLDASIFGDIKFKGIWDARTNQPEITKSSGTDGDYYIVSSQGVWNDVEFNVGDWIFKSNGIWTKIENSTHPVNSVNGKTGNVVIGIGDIEGLGDGLSKIDEHINNTNNPHKVTANQITKGRFTDAVMPLGYNKLVKFVGIWDAGSNNPQLSNKSLDQDGNFYIVREPGVWHGYNFFAEDIIINCNGDWYRICGGKHVDELESKVKDLQNKLDSIEERLKKLEEGGVVVPPTDKLQITSLDIVYPNDEKLVPFGSYINGVKLNWNTNSSKPLTVTIEIPGADPIVITDGSTEIDLVNSDKGLLINSEEVTVKVTVSDGNETVSKSVNILVGYMIWNGAAKLIKDAASFNSLLGGEWESKILKVLEEGDRTYETITTICPTDKPYLYYMVPDPDSTNIKTDIIDPALNCPVDADDSFLITIDDVIFKVLCMRMGKYANTEVTYKLRLYR